MRRILPIVITSVLGGCGEAPLPPAPEPPPAQSQLVDAPIPLPDDWPRVLGKSGRLRETFQQGLSEWRDVRQEGHSYPWLYPGTWIVTAEGLLHDEIRRPPAVSFRRYAGKAFGTPNGELPARYRVSLDVTPLDAHPENHPPVGDLGIPVFYCDPSHYVEVVLKPESFEVWACDGGLPSKWRGWHPLYQKEVRNQAGKTRRLGAEVDAEAGTMTVLVDGVAMGTVRHTLLQPYSHYFALRATGNKALYADVRIESD